MDSIVCRSATLLVLAGALAASAQTAPPADWRRIGSTTLDLRLASPAGGPVERVWHADESLFIQTAAGAVFKTTDYETWVPSPSSQPPAIPSPAISRPPETAALRRVAESSPGRLYAAGANAWRSEDGGLHWTNLTSFANRSILGDSLADVSVAPDNPDDVVVAGRTGVWRSLDGGQSWNGLNAGLPNLSVRKILATPTGTQPLRIALQDGEAVWRAGDKAGWVVDADAQALRLDAARRQEVSQATASEIRVLAQAGEVVYAGAVDGRLFATSNGGRSWRQFPVPTGGLIESIAVDPRDPMFAAAAVTVKDRGRILRTTNGGVFWDDLTAETSLAPVHGVAVDRTSGAVYAATSKGVLMTYAPANGTPPTWVSLSAGLPEAPAVDLKLGDGAHQLYVALQGYGVYATLAPHRLRDPKVVSAGDLAARAAAPGALLTVIGRSVESARSGDQGVPVLSSTPVQSQIQVPFAATGSRLSIALTGSGTTMTADLPLQRVAPVIFVDADGSPLITDAETGLLLDASSPVKPQGRLQILATGLGRVRPDWPAGMAAPLQDSPAVIAPVRVFLDREPLAVTRAVLAPGLVGFYLVEVQVPELLNTGTSELFLEVAGQESNRVKLYTEQ
jgi:uncharacterized protein (TIGR03437 family)